MSGVDEDRTVDTGWLLAAVSAIEAEFECRLKLDDEFEEFAETLAYLNGMTQGFIRGKVGP